MCVVAVSCVVAGCGGGGTEPTRAASSAPSASDAAPSFDPARIKRVHADLPAGYEVGDAGGPAVPALLWGIRPDWHTDPPQCAALLDPLPGAQGFGLSGSGDGGLLHVMAAAAPPGQPTLDPVLLADCGHWSVVAGRSSATVTAVPAPEVDDAVTVGLSAEVRTVVESGTETDSRTHTFVAHLDGGLVFVTLTVDPGSPHPPLPVEDAAALLVTAVSAVRGQRPG
jgi:hypothetical protein